MRPLWAAAPRVRAEPAAGLPTLSASAPGRRHRPAAAPRASSSDDPGSSAPDWDAEMSLFRRRVSAPNQLAALRAREAQVELGTVLYAGDGLAIVRGLDNDAPVGTVLSFVGGARG
jgi:F-type H+-transporting ATPase subunit alpha